MFSSLRQPKKTHRVSRDTKTEGNRRFPRFPVLSLSPCGERFREGQEPSLGKEGRVVVKNPFLRRRGWG